MGKPLSRRNFPLKCLLIIEDCKYNYTAEIKFGKSLSVAFLWGKQILSSTRNMLRTCAWSMRKVKLDKVRVGLRPITLRFRANRVHRDPP